MISYVGRLQSYHELLSEIAQRARALRLRRALRQDEVAERAGIGVATVVRFEKSGRASFENVARIATALDAEAGFSHLFEAPTYASLDEALAATEPARPQRAPRRSR